MIFLEWWNPFTWASDVESSIVGAIIKSIRTAFFTLDTIIYKLIINLYDMFMSLCSARLLSNEVLEPIATRIGLVLGLVMLFFVVLSFVQMLLNPDAISDKEKGAVSIIKKVIIVIVMLGTASAAFNLLFFVQKSIVESNILSKLLLPYAIEMNINGDESQVTSTLENSKFGSLLSEELLMAFYHLEPLEEDAKLEDEEDDNLYSSCESTINAFRTQIINYKRFDLGYNCLNESMVVSYKIDSNMSDPQEMHIVDFNWLLSALCGIAVVYLLFMYCLKVGVRMVQLMFLEIISPMAFVSYLSPKKDTVFDKWKKIYFSTYIDVFIRILIINFVFFLIATVFSSDPANPGKGIEIWNTLSVDESSKTFFTVVIILALLTFAKKAPDLIKELLPSSASKLGFGASMKDIVGVKKGFGIGSSIIGGAAGGAAIGLLGGGLGGFLGGALKGGVSGIGGKGIGKTATSAWKNQSATNKRISAWRNEGGGGLPFGRWNAAFNQWRGVETAADRFDMEKSRLESENSVYKSFDSYLDAAEKRAEGQILKGKFASNVNAQNALKQKNLAEIYRQQSANVKRSDYTDDISYQNELERIAKLASDADSAYLNDMKAAKRDYITGILNGSESDAPTLQNLQQAAGVVAANMGENYSGFAGVTAESLLRGDYDSFDKVNGDAKAQQASNNNALARNAKAGERARANAKYSGRGK